MKCLEDVVNEEDVEGSPLYYLLLSKPSPWKTHSILSRQSRDAFSAGIAHMKICYADGGQVGNHFTYVK